jgi:hypothetical protein
MAMSLCRCALAIAIALVGCKPETARKADTASKKVIDEREQVRQAAQDKPHEVAVESKELGEAAQHFAESKRIRVAALRGEHSVIATQLMLISTMAEYFPLTAAGRADVTEMLAAFHMRLDVAKNQIEALAGATVDDWEDRDDAVREAMTALDQARAAAWRALNDAPHTPGEAS